MGNKELNSINEIQYEFSNKIEILDKIEKVVYITQPSPVVLVSTINKDGINNLAPFGMFMNCSTNPHMVALGIHRESDTYKNIIETKEFVVSIPSESIIKQLYKSGENYPSNESEFDIIGLTPYQSPNIKAKRVMECVTNIDCILENNVETGNHNLIIGRVAGADIDKNLYSEDKAQLRLNMPRIYHLTSNKFLIDNKIKEVEE